MSARVSTPRCGQGHSLADRHSFRRRADGARICLICFGTRYPQNAKAQRASILARQRVNYARREARKEDATLLAVVQRLDAAGLTVVAGAATIAPKDVLRYLRNPEFLPVSAAL